MISSRHEHNTQEHALYSTQRVLAVGKTPRIEEIEKSDSTKSVNEIGQHPGTSRISPPVKFRKAKITCFSNSSRYSNPSVRLQPIFHVGSAKLTNKPPKYSSEQQINRCSAWGCVGTKYESDSPVGKEGKGGMSFLWGRKNRGEVGLWVRLALDYDQETSIMKRDSCQPQILCHTRNIKSPTNPSQP